jgi:hypothetical protein
MSGVRLALDIAKRIVLVGVGRRFFSVHTELIGRDSSMLVVGVNAGAKPQLFAAEY